MQTFRKDERLRGKKVIQLLFKNGNNLYVAPFRIIWMDHETDSKHPAQVLISVSKRNIKTAVDRNIIKRRIREAYRKNKAYFYEFLTSHQKHCIFGILYLEKAPIPYKDVEEKIIIILERLISEYKRSYNLH
jgi:ribonuclease P protein component